MFTILTTKEQDLVALKLWCNTQQLPFDDLLPELPFSMLLRVDDEIKGLIAYTILDEEICKISTIYVNSTERGQSFGDALLRSLMNLLDKRGFKQLLAPKMGEVGEFFVHVGFEPYDEDESCYIIPSIDAFFKKPCKGK